MRGANRLAPNSTDLLKTEKKSEEKTRDARATHVAGFHGQLGNEGTVMRVAVYLVYRRAREKKLTVLSTISLHDRVKLVVAR